MLSPRLLRPKAASRTGWFTSAVTDDGLRWTVASE